MKTFLILMFSFTSMVTLAQAPKFTVDNSSHKFEDTREGEVLTHTFLVTNSGETPLIISDYKVACPCTKVILPADPVLPGQTYKMKVTFDTKGKTEWQDRAILLQTNTKKKEEKLRIKVYVIPKE